MIRTYALLSYAAFLAVLLYIVGWVADTAVPKGIDDGRRLSTPSAVVIDLALLGLFAIQHSVMARSSFKEWSRRLIPLAAERATYVLTSSAAVALLAWLWVPLPQVVWSVDGTVPQVFVWVVYAAGWLIVVASTFMIGHFDLFGLTQALRGDRYREQAFGTPGLYALVRHPIMTGFIVAFWAVPHMTAGHLLFAAASTVYILAAVRLEERDLRAHLGDDYVDYATRVPRFVPAARRQA